MSNHPYGHSDYQGDPQYNAGSYYQDDQNYDNTGYAHGQEDVDGRAGYYDAS